MSKIILIDNDKFICIAWKLKARESNVDLHIFNAIDDFLNSATNFSFCDQIYVDSDLGNGIKGEIESRKIYDLGFKNIYIATGHEPSSFDTSKLTWIKEVISKMPPF